MKRVLSSLFVAMFAYTLCYADASSTTPQAPSNVYFNLGKLQLLVPFNEVDVTYLYDVIGNRNLIGGETPLVQLWNIQGTVGAVTSMDGRGAPYVGGKLKLPNPVPRLAFFGDIQPGLFGGYDWNRGAAIAGFKADLPIFN